jgi:hypothetical protein
LAWPSRAASPAEAAVIDGDLDIASGRTPCCHPVGTVAATIGSSPLWPAKPGISREPALAARRLLAGTTLPVNR